MSTWPFIDPDAVLEMESAGQSELIAGAYKVGFFALPARLQDGPASQEDFEALGFEFGEVIEGDLSSRSGTPLWRLTKLPGGWRLEPEPENPYSYWTLILDAEATTRGRIFYKAASYDKDAFMRLESEH